MSLGCTLCLTLSISSKLPNLTNLGNFAFFGCGLERIESLGQITEIVGDGNFGGTFQGCAALSFVRIPATVSSIGAYAFYNDSLLRTFICEAVVPPTLVSTALGGVPSDMVIYVPDGSVDAYKEASGWSSRASYIKPLSEYNG